jgi:hypothetical protein
MKSTSNSVERVRAILELRSHLLDGRAEYTPAEVLRAARFVPGWAVAFSRGGRWVVTGGGVVDKSFGREALATWLVTRWLPEAEAAVRDTVREGVAAAAALEAAAAELPPEPLTEPTNDAGDGATEDA